MTKYAVMIETAGGRCDFPVTGLATREEATAAMRACAEYDMNEMGEPASAIKDWRDGSLLAPGGIYSVVEQDAALDELLAEREAERRNPELRSW
jgi:hypothetical protein